MARILIDTSAVYALIDKADANHAAARRGLERMRAEKDTPLLTNFIVAESHALLLSRLGADVARTWLTRSIWPIERVTPEDEAAAKEIMRTHTDKSYSYVDATSFAVVERLRVRAALAFDRHFRQFGVKLVATQPGRIQER
ncbi:MAG TPA: PIN domain-containing protein [Polyangia bacterium]|nr:PIN domain-containing protein [Polyangia bacterium]